MVNLNVRERIERVLEAEAAAISAVSVTEEFERAVLALRDCRGKVLAAGMGKAGHIARKFAATLCSTGTPAAYIHPGEAAHGDLGLIGPEDCIVAFSNSGMTREVLETEDGSLRLPRSRYRSCLCSFLDCRRSSQPAGWSLR